MSLSSIGKRRSAPVVALRYRAHASHCFAPVVLPEAMQRAARRRPQPLSGIERLVVTCPVSPQWLDRYLILDERGPYSRGAGSHLNTESRGDGIYNDLTVCLSVSPGPDQANWRAAGVAPEEAVPQGRRQGSRSEAGAASRVEHDHPRDAAAPSRPPLWPAPTASVQTVQTNQSDQQVGRQDHHHETARRARGPQRRLAGLSGAWSIPQ